MEVNQIKEVVFSREDAVKETKEEYYDNKMGYSKVIMAIA